MSKRKRLNEAGWARLAERLARLLESGVPLFEALGFIVRRGGALERTQAAEIMEALRAGHSLSRAFVRGGAPLLMQTLVEVGEHNGDLPGSLFRSATHAKDRLRWQRESLQAMLYPSVVGVVLLFVMVFLFTVVLPRFTEMYAGMGLQAEGSTAYLFAIAEGAPNVFGGGAVLLAVAAALVWRSTAARSVLLRVCSRLPVLSRWLRVGRSLEWCATLGLLLDGGMPLLHALNVQAALPLRDANRALCQRIRERVLQGGMLSDALQDDLLEESLTLGIRVAEVTGDLPSALLAAEKELTRVRQELMGTMLKLFEPLLMIVTGTLVGLAALFMLLPMLDLIQAI